MQPQPNPIISLIPIAAIFVIFYVLLIRPQRKQQREHEQMLADLKKGDRVLTTGGLYGTIVGIKGNDLEVSFSQSVKLTVARSAVSQRLAAAAAVGGAQ
ncbi:MAG: preprotein translocase subunit YajC [Elusimicrobia bacterium]|nr:preprotein translocase subunit YajC [Elusimicrobiota bacterium]MDE2237798.1 preprotein translocase subunit YajC [Elusimicrobiota bacterium]MDE2424871.1 preprotein translocase subunit YajC [Elusimicrobiota bacterium]